jgi:hypothetical protein
MVFVPAGDAWLRFLAIHPSTNPLTLYASDAEHPGVEGSQMYVYSLYRALTDRPSSSLPRGDLPELRCGDRPNCLSTTLLAGCITVDGAFNGNGPDGQVGGGDDCTTPAGDPAAGVFFGPTINVGSAEDPILIEPVAFVDVDDAGFYQQAADDAIGADDDLDGANNVVDTCPVVFNDPQTDTDRDGFGDVCDLDDDNDLVADPEDDFPLDPCQPNPEAGACAP